MTHGFAPGACLFILGLVAGVTVSPWLLLVPAVQVLYSAKS